MCIITNYISHLNVAQNTMQWWKIPIKKSKINGIKLTWFLPLNETNCAHWNRRLDLPSIGIDASLSVAQFDWDESFQHVCVIQHACRDIKIIKKLKKKIFFSLFACTPTAETRQPITVHQCVSKMQRHTRSNVDENYWKWFTVPTRIIIFAICDWSRSWSRWHHNIAHTHRRIRGSIEFKLNN